MYVWYSVILYRCVVNIHSSNTLRQRPWRVYTHFKISPVSAIYNVTLQDNLVLICHSFWYLSSVVFQKLEKGVLLLTRLFSALKGGRPGAAAPIPPGRVAVVCDVLTSASWRNWTRNSHWHSLRNLTSSQHAPNGFTATLYSGSRESNSWCVSNKGSLGCMVHPAGSVTMVQWL